MSDLFCEDSDGAVVLACGARDRIDALEAERDDLTTRLRSAEIVRDLMRIERDRLRGLLERVVSEPSRALAAEILDALAEIRGDEAPQYRPPAPRPYREQVAAALKQSCSESCDGPGCAGGCRT